MTTTGSSDGRPQPQPQPHPQPQSDAAADSQAEPAAPDGQAEDHSAGDAPTPSAQPSQSSDADESSGSRESLASIVAETLGLAPGSSRRRRAVTLVVMLLLAFVAVFRDTLIGYVMIEPGVVKENDSNAEYDADKVPFTVSVRPEEDEPDTWTMVLDRALTPDEKRKLVAGGNRSAAFSYLKELGGHPLAHEAAMEYAPERYKRQLASEAIGRYADVFQMNVMSTRSTSVIITGWKITDLTCRKSTGHTVVVLPRQGGSAYEGIQLHLPPLAGEPVLSDETEGQGEPYFSTRYIEVGGGQPAGGFKVQAIAPPGQSCEWGLKVRYTDSYQRTQWIQLKDGKGEPLRIHTDSAPLDPRQEWVFVVQPWRLCDQEDLSKCVV